MYGRVGHAVVDELDQLVVQPIRDELDALGQRGQHERARRRLGLRVVFEEVLQADQLFVEIRCVHARNFLSWRVAQHDHVELVQVIGRLGEQIGQNVYFIVVY